MIDFLNIEFFEAWDGSVYRMFHFILTSIFVIWLFFHLKRKYSENKDETIL